MPLNQNIKNVLSFIPGIMLGNGLNQFVDATVRYIGFNRPHYIYYILGAIDLLIVFTLMSMAKQNRELFRPYDEFIVWGMVLSHDFYLIRLINDGVDRTNNEKII